MDVAFFDECRLFEDEWNVFSDKIGVLFDPATFKNVVPVQLHYKYKEIQTVNNAG